LAALARSSRPVAGILLVYPDLSLEVAGHTDSVGDDDYNQALSERRAEAVRAYLIQRGIPGRDCGAWIWRIAARGIERDSRRTAAGSTCGTGGIG
jgi:outer membrane protein OmpA-like peptidoglycan-associated protein